MTEKRYKTYRVDEPVSEPFDGVIRGWGELYEICSLNAARSLLYDRFGPGYMVVTTDPVGFPVDNPPWRCNPKPDGTDFSPNRVLFWLSAPIFSMMVMFEPVWRLLGFKPHLYYRYEK